MAKAVGTTPKQLLPRAKVRASLPDSTAEEHCAPEAWAGGGQGHSSHYTVDSLPEIARESRDHVRYEGTQFL